MVVQRHLVYVQVIYNCDIILYHYFTDFICHLLTSQDRPTFSAALHLLVPLLQAVEPVCLLLSVEEHLYLDIVLGLLTFSVVLEVVVAALWEIKFLPLVTPALH